MEYKIEDKVIDFLISTLNFDKLENITSQVIFKKFGIAEIEFDIIINKLEVNDIIDRKKYRRLMCLTKKGFEIKNNGGWLINLESEKLKITKAELKDTLEIDLKTLQKESLEHQLKIRKQTDRIRDLEEQIKFISLIKLYWWLIPTCIVIGVILKEFWDRIQLTR